ncbi:DUF1835 domain-containing protein [Chitinophaga agrisoli]|uniref:DUF1835 domain-containing protein n=1 Tax=Chitinophaga agrisoli TaxID=2607653 RepID=A0A5B2VWP3_9BACT|nr:DUF1835 domain-containing protein [Chitinophaga agrisoli]KAA2243028.1 DUF1835 domain-containing protein [Chitinophaga agrisoli]
MSVLHIVFGQSSKPVLAAAFELDEKIKGDILCFEDDLSIGPLFILDTKDGQANRRQWWQQLAGIQPQPVAEQAATEQAATEQAATENTTAATPPAEEEVAGDPELVKQLKALLKTEPEQEVWIWAGQNARDVCGYYWLVSQLYDFSGRIHIIYLNNLPFLNEKNAVFYPTHLHQIMPREFLKAKKLARPVSVPEFELDGEEWHRLMNENAGVRLLEGGKKIKGEPVAHYDKDLLAQCTKEFQKASKVVSQVTGKLKYPVMDQYLAWRVKELIRTEQLESRGELKTAKEFEVKLPGGGEAQPDIPGEILGS